MLSHYLVKNNSSDAACRIFGHTNTHTHTHTHQQALVRATHLLLGKTITTLVNWTLQTRHTLVGGDMDSYFVMYRWRKTFIL